MTLDKREITNDNIAGSMEDLADLGDEYLIHDNYSS